MLRLFVVIALLLFSFCSANDYTKLNKANTLLKSKNKSDQFRAYNDYKDLYLRSIMAEDSRLRLHALKGIVESGEKLRIDVSEYESELASAQRKQTEATQKQQALSHAKESKQIKLKSSLTLQRFDWKDSKLILKFNDKLSLKQIKYFTLIEPKKESFRYVFDIEGAQIVESPTLNKDSIDEIKISQFTPSTLRIVFENSQKLEISYKVELSRLIITIDENDIVTQKMTGSYYQNPPKKTNRDKTVVIDAGHGGKDPGAIGAKRVQEKKVVFAIAKEVYAILKARGYRVYMTRDRDTFVKLTERTQMANEKSADIFVSIHANSVAGKSAEKACGVESYFLSPSRSERASAVAEKENSADISDMNMFVKENFLNFLNHRKIIASNKLAIDIQKSMLASLRKEYGDVADGGVREGPFWVLVGAQMPAVLVEVGFLSHPTEGKRLSDERYQKRISLGIANGIERYFINN
ncbi:MAG: N-acetylmuramoyl-L-alanine amidase [Epsilonproteobacteria bacterium]|nr:N-acetylmuramoyl-L-alanine amidase [Campylobacterota bacterium]